MVNFAVVDILGVLGISVYLNTYSNNKCCYGSNDYIEDFDLTLYVHTRVCER